MIKDMQARHAVNIQIKRPEGVTEITGAGAEACAAEIRGIIRDAAAQGPGGAPGGGAPAGSLEPGAVTETIMCDGVEGRIIGKGGQNIRALMERTGARVKVYSDRHICEISGAPPAVAAAAELVNAQVADFRAGGQGAGIAGGAGRRHGRARGVRARGGGATARPGVRGAAAGVRRVRGAAASVRRIRRGAAASVRRVRRRARLRAGFDREHEPSPGVAGAHQRWAGVLLEHRDERDAVRAAGVRESFVTRVTRVTRNRPPRRARANANAYQ